MSALRCVGFELAARDPGALARFYCEALGFTCVGEDAGGGIDLKLGACGLRLHPAPHGRAMPPDSHSHDRWFRHLAIVVRDMHRAYEHIQNFQARMVSEHPQTLPAWNPDAGGIEALYFRDPEGHPIELIHFPPDKGRPQWQTPGAELFQGVDHSAIVVADTTASLAFYHRLTGVSQVAQAHNHGATQARLGDLAGADLLATSLGDADAEDADKAPSLELLEYLAPLDGRTMPADTAAGDAWWSASIFRRDSARDAQPAREEFVDPDGYRVVIL